MKFNMFKGFMVGTLKPPKLPSTKKKHRYSDWVSGMSKQNWIMMSSHKKVKDTVTILRVVFCKDKGQETSENLQMATKTLEKFQDGYGKFVSLTGKILKLNTYVFSTVWNNAWLIDIKDPRFKAFIRRIERFLCKY